MALEFNIRKRLAHFEIDLNLQCHRGELLAIVGPSGSGKTTVVRILAGLETPDSGFIRLHDTTLCDVQKKKWIPAQKRKLGYVFQEGSLFPHLNIRKNVAFSCSDPQQVEKLLHMMAIYHLRDKNPGEISGGERQRVAFAQTLASNPDLLLLDEPFSALDISTRQQLRENVLALKQELAIPIILITHDLEEAALLGDQIVALEQGKTDTGWLARMEKIVAKKDLRSVTGRSRCGKCCKPDNFMISQGAAQIGGQSSHVSG